MEASAPVPAPEHGPNITIQAPVTPPRQLMSPVPSASLAEAPGSRAQAVGTPISPAGADVSDAHLRDARAADILNLLFSLKRQRLVADYSNIFGRETRRILPFERMAGLRKRTTALVLPTLVFVMAPRSGGEKEVSFTSFFGSYRDDCHDVCMRLLTRHRPEGVSGTGGTPHVSFAPQRGDDRLDAGVRSAESSPTPGSAPVVTSDDGAVPSPNSSSRDLQRDTRKRSGSLPSLTSGSFSEGSAPTPRAAMSAARPSQLSRDDSDDRSSASPLAPSTSLRSRAATAGQAALLTPLHVDMPIASEAAQEVAFASPLPPVAAASPAAMATGTAAPVHPSLWTRLGRMRVTLDLVLPVSIADFHAQCIAETSTFSIADFHKEEGDYNVTTSQWVQIASGTPAAQASREVPNGDALVTRTVRLVMPLKPGPFMPKETSVEKVQRFAQYAGPVLVVDTFAKSFDVPFGDYFVTEDSWLVCPVDVPIELAGRSLPPAAAVDAARAARAAACNVDAASVQPSQLCRVLVLLFVSFSKSTMFKSRIVAQAELSVGEFYNKWAQRVRAHLTNVISARAAAAVNVAAPVAAPIAQSSSPPVTHAEPVQDESRTEAHAGTATVAAAAATPASDHDRNASTASVPLQAAMRDFLSPTMAAPRPRSHHEALFFSLPSPTSAANIPRDRLLQDYVRLYASHESVLSQLHTMQQDVDKLRASSASADSAKPFGIDARVIGAAVVLCVLVVILVVLAYRQRPDSGAVSALTEEVWSRLQERMMQREAEGRTGVV